MALNLSSWPGEAKDEPVSPSSPPAAPHASPGGRPTTGGVAVYAIGDVHGCYTLLTRLLAAISADQAASEFKRRPKLIFLGDYVDRGPDSARVLEALRWIKASPRFDTTLLMGNHEQGLLDFIHGSSDAAGWLKWGGAQTLQSYGVRPPAPDDAQDQPRARDELLQAMPASHLDLLTGLELMVTVGHYAFVHAGVRPEVNLEDQQAHDLLWIRDDFISSDAHFGKIVVHGHTWIDARPQVMENRIGVDTGAYETGVLTAVRLCGEAVSFLRVGEEVSDGQAASAS